MTDGANRGAMPGEGPRATRRPSFPGTGGSVSATYLPGVVGVHQARENRGCVTEDRGPMIRRIIRDHGI